MKPMTFLLAALFLFSCNTTTQDKKKETKKKKEATEVAALKSSFTTITKMPEQLREISGIVKDGNSLWAISDETKSDIYKLDFSGKPIQQLTLKNISLTDVEAITADNDYLYIADMGDNDGIRQKRQIISVKKSAIGSGEKDTVAAEIITFSFPKWHAVKKKEDNNYDCEAILHYQNALYLFTKRRGDLHTELFMLPETPGGHIAKFIAAFNSKGLITSAAINEAGNEIALTGYQDEHQKPFIWLLSGFRGNNFFSGQQQQFILTNRKKEWQVEGVTFKDSETLFFTCEETPDEPATLYSINKNIFNQSPY